MSNTLQHIVQHKIVDQSKIILPPLHIKLGLMKNLVKGMNQDGESYNYLAKKFTQLNDTKIKKESVGSQIHKILKDLTSSKSSLAKKKQL